MPPSSSASLRGSRKAIHLEILSFGATKAGRKLGGDFQRGEAEKVMRRAEKVASRALFTPSEGKNKKGKNAVMGQKCTFSTLISVGKVKRIYRKRWGKVDEFQNILREKCRINKTRIYKKNLLIHL